MSAPETTNSPAGISRRDLQFLLHEWLKVEQLATRERFKGQSRELYDDTLELAERIAADRFVPHNRAADENEPEVGPDGTVVLTEGVKEALDAFFEAGLGSTAIDESEGGLGLPATVSSAAFSFFQAANVGTSAYAMLTIAAANLLLANGSREQIERYAHPMLEGRFYGTMCLSETQAGSSLSDITTRAELQPDGTYRVFGNKMWISAGDHELSENIIHLVLAKIPGGPPGVKGISLFVVPRFLVNEDGTNGERNDVVLAGINHKMGFRGTVNTVLGFGEGEHRPNGEPGAVGYLIGEQHHGLAYMFHMMNEARVGVGLGATALGYAGYLKSAQYAKERPQGRPVMSKDPATPQVPIIEHADVRRMLLAQKSYVEGALALVLYCAKLLDDSNSLDDEEKRGDSLLLLDFLTPITKSWPSQWCLEANSLAIQVHGGYGYAREYGVEQFYRDNRLNAIHEGAHGIQAMDLLGRKVTMHNGKGLMLLMQAIGDTVSRARDAGSEAAELAEDLDAQLQRLLEVTGKVWADRNVELALANATTYLEAAGHIVIAWLWLEQLLACGKQEGAFYDGKRQAARYFYRFELPRTGPQLDLLASLDRTLLDTQPDWL